MKGENIFKRKDGRREARYVKNRARPVKLFTDFAMASPIKRSRKKSQSTKRMSRKLQIFPRLSVVKSLQFSAMIGLNPAEDGLRLQPVRDTEQL